MDITITPARLSGEITPPPSKSQAHRLLMAACLSGNQCTIENLAYSQDIMATQHCMKALVSKGNPLPLLDCGESGSTLRFLMPISLTLGEGGRFVGHGRLMDRPQEPYFEIFDRQGVSYQRDGDVLTLKGKLSAGEFSLAGNISSQFITGLLFALPLLEGDSTIILTTDLESVGYVDMTMAVLEEFGIKISYDGNRTFTIPGGQTYQGKDCAVEPDWSQAGFWYSATGVGNDVTVTGMNHNSSQGDRAMHQWAEELSGEGEVTLDISQCPDLAPPLAAYAALRTGTTHLINASRLRIKESDRLEAIADVLTILGVTTKEEADSLTIQGQPTLSGGTVSSHNDHRIAMMAAILATKATAPVTVLGAHCVSKSYPNFWENYEALGGNITAQQ